MNKLLTLSFLSVAALGASSAAFAQDAPSWDGPYVGLSLGQTKMQEAWTSDEDFPGTISSHKKKSTGISLIFGDNFQRKNLVVGFEVDFGTGGGKYTSSYTDFPAADPEFDSISGDLQASGHLRGRVGYAVGQFLPYIGAGIACAKVKHTLTQSGDVDHDTTIQFGTSIALGLEYAVTPALKIRGEVIRDSFASTSFQSYDAGSDSYNAKLKTSAFKVGVTYSF